MRFTSVRFNGLSTATFKMIGASQTDPYVITDIQGLGPTEIDVSNVTPARSNAYHLNSFANSRQIVVTITINEDYASGLTVDQLRENLYWMVEDEAAQGVLITLVNEGQDLCFVRGFVSRMVPSIFSSETELQITFECLGSKLLGSSLVTKYSQNGVVMITPEGTARTTPSIVIEIIKPSPSFAIRRTFNNQEREFLALSGHNYVYGDRLVIGSIDGDKTVMLKKVWDRGTHDHIRHVELNVKWPALDPQGVNVLTAWGSDYMQGDVRILSVQYRPMFRGV